MHRVLPGNRLPGLWQERLLWIAMVVMAGAVFFPVVMHPNEVMGPNPYSDFIRFHYAYRSMLSEWLRTRGTVPLWDPLCFAGISVATDPQSGFFYPINWLFALVSPSKTPIMFGPITILHVIIGGWGMLWWLKGFGFSPTSRLIGAMGFVFCGKWFYHVTLSGHVNFLPLVWLPWQCGLIDRTWSSPSFRRTSCLALITAMTLNEYHPQVLLYSQVLLFLYALVSAWSNAGKSWQLSFASLVAAGSLAIVLAMIHLLPVWDALPLVIRGEGLDYKSSTYLALERKSLIGFLLPYYRRMDAGEMNPFIGVAALALSLFSICYPNHRKIKLFFFGCFWFCVIYSLGHHALLHPLIHHVFPGFSSFRIPSRILLLLGLPTGFLAAAGFAALERGANRVAATYISSVLLLVGGFLILAIPSKEAVVSAMFLVCPTIWHALGFRLGAFSSLFMALVFFVDQARFAVPLVITRPLRSAVGRSPIVDELHHSSRGSRVLAMDYPRSPFIMNLLPSFLSHPRRLENVRGYNPLIPRSTFDYLTQGVSTEVKDLPFYIDVPIEKIDSREYLDLLNVRWVVAGERLRVPGLLLVKSFPKTRIFWPVQGISYGMRKRLKTYLYENIYRLPRAMLVRSAQVVESQEEAVRAIPSVNPETTVLLEIPSTRVHYPGDVEEVTIDNDGGEIKASFDAAQGGFLVLSEVYYPGWVATDNGQPAVVHRVNGIFRGLEVGPGRHAINLTYRPWSYIVGRWLTLSGLFIAFLMLFWPSGWRQHKRALPDSALGF